MPTLYFTAREFPTEPEGNPDLCNGRPGSAVAAWLKGELTAAGFPCGEPLQEDYGWGFWVDGPAPVWLAVSFAGVAEDDPGGEPEWVLSVAYEFPLFSPGRWFRGREGRAAESAVFTAVEASVRSRAGMTAVPPGA